MARNNYFKVSNRESDLFEQLVIEQVRIYGFDVHYIFRKFQNLDSLFGEDPISKFNKSFQVEMFVSNYEFFETQGKFIDKFGLNLQDSVTLMVPKKRFEEEAARFGTETKPQEGDIIYFPEYGGLYEIKYVGSRNSFFSYELSCELFRYSGEDISTEILEVDEIEDKLITSIRELTLSGLSGSFYDGETIYQGTTIGSSTYSAVLIDFNKTTGVAQVHSERGTISSIPQIKGEKSEAFAFYDSAQTTNRKIINNNTDDTAKIESERAQKNIIDFSDIDPFSEGNY